MIPELFIITQHKYVDSPFFNINDKHAFYCEDDMECSGPSFYDARLGQTVCSKFACPGMQEHKYFLPRDIGLLVLFEWNFDSILLFRFTIRFLLISREYKFANFTWYGSILKSSSYLLEIFILFIYSDYFPSFIGFLMICKHFASLAFHLAVVIGILQDFEHFCECVLINNVLVHCTWQC